MCRLLNRGCRDSFRGYRGCREGVAAAAATNIYGECAQAGKLTFPHKNHTTGPAGRRKTGSAASQRKTHASLAPLGEGSGVSPPRVRGGVAEGDRRGVLSYEGKLKQFVPCVTFVRRSRNTTGEGTAFSLIFRKWFQ